MKYLKFFESFKTFKHVDPKGVYPNSPGGASFGSSPIRILKDREEWNLEAGYVVDMDNVSNYGGIHYAIRNDEDEFEIDPSTFVEGVDFEWI